MLAALSIPAPGALGLLVGCDEREDGKGYAGREDYNSQGEFMGVFRRVLRRLVGTSGGDGYI